MAVHEQFAHGQRSGCLLADGLEPGHIFGRHNVFEEEQPVRLQRLGQHHRLGGRNALVDIVHKLHVEPEFRTQLIEHLDGVIHVRGGLKYGRLRHAPRPEPAHVGGCLGCDAVTGKARHGELDTNMAIALLLPLLDLFN